MEILTASWVAPVSRPPIARGLVAVEGERIVWVGARRDPAAPPGDGRDLGPGVLMPGLVNAHCHLELSHLAGIDGSRGFVPWVRSLVQARAGGGGSQGRSAAQRAVDDLVASGTVAVGDVSNTLAHVDLLAASPLHAVVFHELIAWDPATADTTFAAASDRPYGAGVGRGESRVSVRLAAHAPHSVSAKLLRLLVSAGGPASIHLAESAAESRFLAAGDGEWREFLAERQLGHVAFDPPGCTPVSYADSLGILHERLVAAHCVQTDANDIPTLAARGVHVALCPRSNLSLGHGLPRLPEMLRAGVRLCLGTDSLASVPSLDLLQDAAVLHREFPEVEGAAIVRMATLGGATALGFRDIGVIEPGRRAALAFAPADKDPQDPIAFLLSGDAKARRIEL